MAQIRVNGSVAADQFLTGELKHFILDVPDAVMPNVSSIRESKRWRSVPAMVTVNPNFEYRSPKH